jgi:hypothetical protein
MTAPRKSLDDLLAEVPRDVPAPQDLWPGIALAIRRRREAPRVWAIAASVAVLGVTGAIAWIVLARRPADLPSQAATHVRSVSFEEPRDASYVAARADLEKSFHERLATLKPETRAKIQASLAVIREAHLQIRQALAADPANPVLEHLLESTWHDEFDLYEDVVQGTQPAIFRS